MGFWKSREDQIIIRKSLSWFDSVILQIVQYGAAAIGFVVALLLYAIVCYQAQFFFDLFSRHVANSIFIVLMAVFVVPVTLGSALFVSHFYFWLRCFPKDDRTDDSK